jgi:uncharacterized protein (TIGR02466 family)
MLSSLQTEIWFPTFISYTYNKEILPKIQHIFDNFNWNLVVDDRYPNGYTTFYGGIELSEELKQSMPELCEFILINSYELAERQKINLEKNKLKITSFWLNRMLKNGFHSKHLHTHSLYSGTYYTNVDNTNSNIVFFDSRLYKQFSPKIVPEEIVQYKPENGKMLLWDSYLEHEVDVNVSDKPRDSISFNINVSF